MSEIFGIKKSTSNFVYSNEFILNYQIHKKSSTNPSGTSDLQILECNLQHLIMHCIIFGAYFMGWSSLIYQKNKSSVHHFNNLSRIHHIYNPSQIHPMHNPSQIHPIHDPSQILTQSLTDQSHT